MNRFYYHGLGDFYPDITLDIVLEIIKSGGLKTRNEVRGYGDGAYSHICLYRKNDEYDYKNHDALIKSARGGWIDHCVFFIISPDIEAKKVAVGNGTGIYDDGTPYTNLVDEWRSAGDIPLEAIVGIAFPFDSIKELKERFPQEFDDTFSEKLSQILNYAKSMGWIVENSDTKDLCDKLDESLNSQIKVSQHPSV